MEPTVILLFESYDDAMQARDAVAHRHAEDLKAVRVELRDDEAGPVQGNFVTGNKHHDGRQTGAYAEQYKSPSLCGSVLVIAECLDAQAVQRVTESLVALGGRQVQSPAG
jgi:hypothetical protein